MQPRQYTLKERDMVVKNTELTFRVGRLEEQNARLERENRELVRGPGLVPGRECVVGLGGLCSDLPVLRYASNSWICSYYASHTSHIMLILSSVMYFDLKHMLVALVQNVLPALT